MRTLAQELDWLDDVLDDVKYGDGVSRDDVESIQRVLIFLRELGPNLVGLSEEDYESMLLKAIRRK